MSKIKLCGLMNSIDAYYANEAAPDYVGLVFDKRRHFISDERAFSIRQALDSNIPAIGVFVNEPQKHIINLVQQEVIQFVQLHGCETETYITKLKEHISCPIIKVVSVKTTEDILMMEHTKAEYIMFDHGIGGTGKTFNWKLIPAIIKPWFFAGGINLSNIEKALDYHPFCIDISSGAETDGVKNREKMIALVNKVRLYNQQMK